MIDIDPGNHEPIFSQIVSGILREIVAGVWRAGEAIPGRRSLSADLRVNPNTVMASYRELTQLGVLEVRRGLGFFVTQAGLSAARRRLSGRLEAQAGAFVSSAKQLGMGDGDIVSVVEKALGSAGTDDRRGGPVSSERSAEV